MSETEVVRSHLEADRRDLLDLSLRNPLLNYRPRVRSLELVGESPSALFRALVVEGRSLAFDAAEPVGDGQPAEPSQLSPTENRLQTNVPAEDLDNRLKAIHLAARTAIEEQGGNTLFLTIGMLQWTDEPPSAAARILRAPVVLIPVELTRTGVREWFRVRHDGQDPEANLSLAEMLRTEYGLILPPIPEENGHDLNSYLDAVATLIKDQPGWKLDRETSVIGFFSFGKFLMYRDLDPSSWPEGSGPTEHPIVARLLGDGFPGESPPMEDEDRPKTENESTDLKLVLDADSSQADALREIAKGRDLVIQGPPGTGKSQTITNLIADAIGRGRTVLFVAEKLAALEVVKRRLDAIGLGSACLELHSQKTSKRAVLDQLRRTLGQNRPRRGPAASDPKRRDELAAMLDAHCEAINSPIGESQVTPHEAIGQLLHLRHELAGLPPTDLELPGAEDWSAADFRAFCKQVEHLQVRQAALGRWQEHPFFGSRRAVTGIGDEVSLRERLETAGQAAQALRASASALAGVLQLSPALNRSACEALIEAARRLTDLARWGAPAASIEWRDRRPEIRTLIESGKALEALRERFGRTLLEESWSADVLPIRQAINARGRSWWRWLSPSYQKAVTSLAGLCRGEPPTSLADRLAILDAILESQRLLAVIHDFEELGSRLFADLWKGECSAWRAFDAISQGMYRLHLDVDEGRLPRGLLERPADPTLAEGLEELVRAVEASLSAHRAAWRRVLDFLDFDESVRFGGEGGLTALPFDRQQDLLRSWNTSQAQLDGLIARNAAAERCRSNGLVGVVALAARWEGAASHLLAAFQQAYYQALLQRAERERPELAEFDGLAHDQRIAEYRQLDQLALAQNRSEIAREHWRRLPKGSGTGFGQVSTLRRELAKKARHLPVRQLMARAGNVIQATTPVFLMSPLSVAAYLPPGAIDFDLVVFDEASQVRPVDALGSLLRGRQAVVVGDTRQLPPTSFFDRLTSGDEPWDEEESSSDLESILGLFSAQGAPERLLQWHYRSRHESLIAVSNREFYEGRLIVFPSPDANRRESGLILRHLPEAYYDRGRSRTNPVEAETVAQAVMAFAREQLQKPAEERLSLGVATFSVAQMAAVSDRIERLRREAPALEDFFDEGAADPFFVKNLENVQGDERDVIFLSIGYGRTADGSVSLNFGPLNGEGGERRLNVLITRARVRCEVFTNLTAEAIDPSRTRSRGVQALRTFLAFARDGTPEEPSLAEQPSEASAGFEDALGVRLEAEGFAVQRRVGSGGCRLDLAVLDVSTRDRYILGVASDGPSYHEITSVRDRDRLRPMVLEGLGWRLQKTWSLDWLRAPEAAAARLLDALPAREPGPIEETIEEAADPIEVIDPASSDEPSHDPNESDGVVPYQMAELPQALAGCDLTEMATGELASLAVEVVRVEGPVHVQEVSRRLADAAHLRRLGPRVQEAIEAALVHAEKTGSIHRESEFLQLADFPGPILRDRSGLPSTSRRPRLVPPEELELALEHVASASFGIEPEALPGAAYRLLGFPRLNDGMRERAEAAMDRLLATERLRYQGDFLVAASATESIR